MRPGSRPVTEEEEADAGAEERAEPREVLGLDAAERVLVRVLVEGGHCGAPFRGERHLERDAEAAARVGVGAGGEAGDGALVERDADELGGEREAPWAVESATPSRALA